MNAIALLKADHRTVKGLFADYRVAGERAHKKKANIAEKVFAELELHTRLEEQIFYPAVRAAGKDLAEDVGESLEEHHVVKLLIAELQQLTPDAEQYDAKFTVLMENVEHHVEEEEHEMFPSAQEKLGKELDGLGQEMEGRKAELKEAIEEAPSR